MRRREFIRVLGGAAAWPLAARAQQPALPVVGFINHGSPEASAHLVAAFRKGLSETGHIEGQNVAIEFRWAHNDNDRLPELAADLVRRQVSVIATPVSTSASLAAKAATTTIPIVFGIGGDPVQAGLVANFNRPGGNVTGISALNWELGAKRLGLLEALLPPSARIAVLINPNTPVVVEPFIKEVQAAAAAIGTRIEIVRASTNREIDSAFASVVQKRADALVVSPEQLFNNRRVQLVGLTFRHGLPAIFPWREAVTIGGLMSYGVDFTDQYRQVGIYAGRVLKGEKPGELPILRASKLELVLNLQTATTLGVTLPPQLLAQADEVIE
jgi:ABC-type uncharacterized transport system substrate-binding protein